MNTYLEKTTLKHVSFKPESYWSGLIDSETKEYIFTGDVFLILNARGHSQPVQLTCTDYIASQANTRYYQKYAKIKLVK